MISSQRARSAITCSAMVSAHPHDQGLVRGLDVFGEQERGPLADLGDLVGRAPVVGAEAADVPVEPVGVVGEQIADDQRGGRVAVLQVGEVARFGVAEGRTGQAGGVTTGPDLHPGAAVEQRGGQPQRRGDQVALVGRTEEVEQHVGGGYRPGHQCHTARTWGSSSLAATSSISTMRTSGARSAAGRARWAAEKGATHTSPPSRRKFPRGGAAPGRAAVTPFSTRNSTTRWPSPARRAASPTKGSQSGSVCGPPLSISRWSVM